MNAKEIISTVKGGGFDKQYAELHWTGSFEDYLNMVLEHPQVARTAFQRMYDMIAGYGSRQFKEYKKEITHWNFFDDPIDGGKDAIFGLDVHLMKLVNTFKAAAAGYGPEKRVILLHGPVGSSKSTIARMLKKGLEVYSKTPEGAMYTYSWINLAEVLKMEDVMRSPMNQEPLYLIPPERREAVLAVINKGRDRANLVRLEGDLSPACRYIYMELMKHYNGDWEKIIKNHTSVHRLALATVLDSARQFYRMNADDESARDTSRPINFNILLSGPPGTGKTEFAKSLAQDLGRDLIVKSASDLLSMWVGGTEKQIAGAFRDAEAAKAILFIDEADTFLFSRGSAGRGWEVSQVNEFLCRMERFKGILICASNHMDNFDSAAIRRFAVKVRFDWLKNDGKEMFFSTCFAPLFARLPESCRGPAILNTKQQSRLESINCLAPGDFKVAYQQHAFRDLTEMDTELLTDNLLAALATEVSYKRDEMGRKIGF